MLTSHVFDIYVLLASHARLMELGSFKIPLSCTFTEEVCPATGQSFSNSVYPMSKKPLGRPAAKISCTAVQETAST